MTALVDVKCRVEVHALLGLVENMTGPAAYKPGDILETWAGKTVEVGNTDAEGRLVLCDLLAYGAAKLKPTHVVDLATESADMEIHGALASDQTGYDLAVGDVNGDTVDDLLFSIHGYDDPGRPNCGAVGVLYGSAAHASGDIPDLAVHFLGRLLERRAG